MTTIITAAATLAPSRRRVVSPPSGGQFAAIIFDMGSTLLEFENVPWPVLYRFCLDEVYRRLERFGYRLPEIDAFWQQFDLLLERRRQRITESSREYRIGDLLRDQTRFFGITLRLGQLEELSNAYYAPIRRGVTMYSDALVVLQKLKQAGYKVGLLSNTCFRARDHREELISFGLWRFLDAAVFTSTGAYRKPHPAPFQLVASRLGVPVKRCLYVGDRQKEDILGPQRLGMTAVLVRRPGRRYVAGLTESVEIASLSELLELIPV